MTRKWLPISAVLIIVVLILLDLKHKNSIQSKGNLGNDMIGPKESLWMPPDSSTIPNNEYGDLIRYGKKLISHTAKYWGPGGSVSQNANGMNCQNCHLDAGTRPWAGNFGAVAAIYPRFSDRRGSPETVNQRITDCFERSMNGGAPDSSSREMKAMNAYISWLGRDVRKGKKPAGAGLEVLVFIDRPADPEKGKLLYGLKCQSCHGADGRGIPDTAFGYLYPPLWGEHSYNTAAGLYRLSKFASFIKDNMPFGSNYKNEQLSTEQAWDLAAYVNSQPRPVRKFIKDWPNILFKPVDVPEGPYPDSYPQFQHKYGPFGPIAKSKKEFVAK